MFSTTILLGISCCYSACTVTLIFMYHFTDDPPREPLSLKVSTNGDQSIAKIINKLHPEMEQWIVIDELVPYSIRHNLLTQIDKDILGPQSTTLPTLKTRHLLMNLDSKGPDGVQNFIKALYESSNVPGHQYLMKLLQQEGVTVECITEV